MHFIVTGYDGSDEEAVERRMKVRNDHLKLAKQMFLKKQLLYAAGILNEKGDMIGSMMVVDFLSKDELEEKWLSEEPYLLAKVWEKVEIKKAAVAPFCLNIF